MSRLDSQTIVNLYQKHRVAPIFGISLLRHPKGNKACAIGIAAIDKDPRFLQPDFISPYRTPEDISKLIGLDHIYAASFAHGFDGKDFKDLTKRDRLGYQDGVAARDAVINAGLKTENYNG